MKEDDENEDERELGFQLVDLGWGIDFKREGIIKGINEGLCN